MLPGAVLAAGRSSRMGRPKAFLPYGPVGAQTFLDRVIASMRDGGVDDILVVGRPDDEALIAAVSGSDTPARFVPNPHHELGQLTSIVAAVNAVDRPGVRGLLVIPVDMPLVRGATFAAILHASSQHPRSIVRAVCGGRHGHPVIFDRAYFDALRHAAPHTGAKAVLRDPRALVVDVEVDDDGVLRDVDDLDDYIAVFGGPPGAPQSGVSS
jgi:molybdenum cofactor cytidylyltransferase